MKLSKLFQTSLEELRKSGCTFAVAGGFAADLYRKEIRGTNDIDYLIFADGDEKKVGKDLLKRLKLTAGEVRQHNITRMPGMNKKSQDVLILVGRNAGDDPGVDFLLPPFSWFKNALERAQSHQVDFGFGPAPVITAEDLILAKLDARRPKDIDDIISIFESRYELDLTYLSGEIERLKLVIPKVLLSYAPKAIKVLFKRTKRIKKSFP